VSARETEIRTLLLQQRLANAARRLPQALRDYARMLLAAAVGYGLLVALLAWLTPVDPLYALAGVALLFSVQAASYHVRLARDPEFTIPPCGCGAGVKDDTAGVLRSRESTILGVPNALLGVVLYTALIAAVATGRDGAALGLALAAGLGSASLGYVMVVRLAAVCSLCVNVAALNLLLLLQLLR
jgi:uncharacterized membrane protein